MSDVDDLATWLRAQLDDDERVASQTAVFDWKRVPMDEAEHDGEGRVETADGQIVIWDHGCQLSRHIGRWSPAQVLAEVDAKRRIIDLHDRDHECAVYVTHQGVTEVDNCAWVLKGDGCSTVRLMTLPYADRPGYRDEWKP